jgi:hypothetical protein
VKQSTIPVLENIEAASHHHTILPAVGPGGQLAYVEIGLPLVPADNAFLDILHGKHDIEAATGRATELDAVSQSIAGAGAQAYLSLMESWMKTRGPSPGAAAASRSR